MKDIKNYSFTFNELKITEQQIYRALGYSSDNPPIFEEGLVEATLNEASEICIAKGGYRYFENLLVRKENGTVEIDNTVFEVGKTIAIQLKNANEGILFTCTAGKEIGDMSKKLMQEGDMMKGYLLDTIGSEAVETAMNIIQKELEVELFEKKKYISNRYSPGYCGWNVYEQHKLFSLLPDKYCGISLTESALMMPVKSISGIIGIGKNVKDTAYPCDLCGDTTCIKRRLSLNENIT